MDEKIAQFLRYGLLLELSFGSSQTADWLLRYGHFTVLGGLAHTVCTRVHNIVQSVHKGAQCAHQCIFFVHTSEH